MKQKTQGKKQKPPRAASGEPQPYTDADARRRLAEYLLSVIEDRKAESKRRDEMAYCLSKVMASGQLRAAKPPIAVRTPRPPAQPRVSTYVSKKRQADAASKTAHENSPWDGLINGSAHPPTSADAEGDDE